MPLTFTATTSSLWMNLARASLRLGAQVYSVSAFSSRLLATSGLGQSWFGCMYEGKSPLAETLTILPGTLRGLKPAGGLAIRASSSAASADVAWASAPAERPTDATRKTSRRETFRDRLGRLSMVASVEIPTAPNITRRAARQMPSAQGRPSVRLAFRQPKP